MSGGAEKPRWKQDDLIVEDIILETEDFTSGHEPPRPPVRNAWDEENKKKKSARSVMKEILKKSKKGISKAMGNKERPSKMNEKTCSKPRVSQPWLMAVTDGSTNLNPSQSLASTSARDTSDTIVAATVLPILSDSARQVEPATVSSRVCTNLSLRPSTTTNFNYTQTQGQLEPQAPVSDVEGLHNEIKHSEKKEEVEHNTAEHIQDVMEEENLVLPGAVPCSCRKPIRKPLKPAHQRRAETEMKNALEKTEEEDRKSMHMSQEMQDKRARLIRIRQGVEDSMKRERAVTVAKKSNEEDAKVVEQKKEKKRKENEKVYVSILVAQKSKIAELKTKLNWLSEKQEGKLKRINYSKGKNLNMEERLKLKSLKHSLKKLDKKLFHTREEISRRKATVKRLAALIKNCRTNPNPLEENPSFADFELARIHVTKCWVVNDNNNQTAHCSTSHHHSAPPPTPAVPDLVRPFNGQAENQEEVSEPIKRPLTRRLAKRLNPKTLVSRLQHRFGKKSQNSRPLGAHPGRLRSVTENMQEKVPYEMQHYDSDEDVADQPTATTSQTAHTAENGRGQESSSRCSPEREFEMDERQMHAMGQHLQIVSETEDPSFSNSLLNDTPNRRRMSEMSSEVPEVDKLREADGRILNQHQMVENRQSNTEQQKNVRDGLLERSENPKTPNLKWATRASRRQIFESDTTSADTLSAHHMLPTVRETVRRYESRPQTTRQHRVTQPAHRMSHDIATDVDQPECEEISTQGHMQNKRSVRHLKSKQPRAEKTSQKITSYIAAEVDKLVKVECKNSCAQNSLTQMTNKRPLTRRQPRVDSKEVCQRVSSEIDCERERKEGSTPNTFIQTPQNGSRRRKVEKTSQRIASYIAAEVDKLFEHGHESEKSSAANTSERMPNMRDLSFDSPRMSVLAGQRRRVEAARRHFDNAGKLLLENQRYYRSSPSQQKENPSELLTHRQTRAVTQGHSSDNADEIDKILSGEIKLEELCSSNTSQQRQ